LDTPIADSYWVIPNKLLAGEYAGQPTEVGAIGRLKRFLDFGITAFIDLTETTERLHPYDHLLSELQNYAGKVIYYTRMPIRDQDVPSIEIMKETMSLIDRLIIDGNTVYVHCWGGIGRTGTVIGCFMKEQWGITGEESLELIEILRKNTPDAHWPSPATEAQRNMVLQWV
tara:strand:+ start:1244 stop:1756 length:513 start_codon:yes stop_codon:yes gene_type:complete